MFISWWILAPFVIWVALLARQASNDRAELNRVRSLYRNADDEKRQALEQLEDTQERLTYSEQQRERAEEAGRKLDDTVLTLRERIEELESTVSRQRRRIEEGY